MENTDSKEGLGSNFIRTFIEDDIKKGKIQKVRTRFPPEPNGYLHIGHAKAITINYETAKEFCGLYNLRFDDTNPVKEDTEYEEAIKRDIKWLGYDWEDRLYYASEYFDTLFDYAVILIKKGLAYVCDLSQEEVKAHRGSLTEPGKNSPFRDRTAEENLDLFFRMKNGEFEEGSRVLRAKIDMSSPNINMRDPVMYRILKKNHHRTGDKWVIYPSYDFTHGQSDSLEGITHSLCDISFENHRPLYEWFIENLGIYPSRQIEFARLNLTYTITSKRFLKKLVDEKIVEGWDDPRMPTLIGMRRKGIPPETIIEFMKSVGVSKKDSLIDVSNFEYFVRENLKKKSPHATAVLDPVKLTVVNFPDNETEQTEMDSLSGEFEVKRSVPFTKHLFIERTDFKEDSDPDFFRLSPGKYVKLRKSYIVKCNSCVKDTNGKITEILCEYVPASQKQMEIEGKKIKGIIHWLSQTDAVPCKIRQYGKLFTVQNPLEARDQDFSTLIDPDSVTVLEDCVVEKYAASSSPEGRFQFIRNGYFCADINEHGAEHPVFNRTITLK